MDSTYREAKKRVKLKKKFYKELSTYVVISVFLLFINIFSGSSYMWSFWAIIPWGIGMALKGIKLISANNTSKWEQNEIRKELISMGKDPDDYIDDHLELREVEREKVKLTDHKGYDKSDLV